jgi:PLP dependent protein
MSINIEQYQILQKKLAPHKVVLIAVSKKKPSSDIEALYNLGQRDFGENYVQELLEKETLLPKDIRWHFIGHLQSNKVKYIAPFIYLVHGVDSLNLLKEVNKQAKKNNRTIRCLLQVHIAQEETKFGFDENELMACISTVKNKPEDFAHVQIAGLMGMASFSSDPHLIHSEFSFLKNIFDKYFTANDVLSMGMSSDYDIALAHGSNMIRVGSLLFGERI